MLLNPLSMEMRYRSGLPVLPGAFPVVGHTPSMYFDSIIDLLKWGQKQAGNLFWMDWGVGCSPLIYLGRDCIDLLKSSEKSGLARFVRSDYRNQPVGDKKRVCVLEPSDSFELDLQ